jgi:hypothetical protein
VGGELMSLHIDFKDPKDYLDVSRFKVRAEMRPGSTSVFPQLL